MDYRDIFCMRKKAADQKDPFSADDYAKMVSSGKRDDTAWKKYTDWYTGTLTDGLSGEDAAAAIARDKQENPDNWDFDKMHAAHMREYQKGRDMFKNWKTDGRWSKDDNQQRIQNTADIWKRRLENVKNDPRKYSKALAQYYGWRHSVDDAQAKSMSHVDAALTPAMHMWENSTVGKTVDKQISWGSGMLAAAHRMAPRIVPKFKHYEGLADWAVGRDPETGEVLTSANMEQEFRSNRLAYWNSPEGRQIAASKGKTPEQMANLETYGLRAAKWVGTGAQMAGEMAVGGEVMNGLTGAVKASKIPMALRRSLTTGAKAGYNSWKFWKPVETTTGVVGDVLQNADRSRDNWATATNELVHDWAATAPGVAATWGFAAPMIRHMPYIGRMARWASSKNPVDPATGKPIYGFARRSLNNVGKFIAGDIALAPLATAEEVGGALIDNRDIEASQFGGYMVLPSLMGVGDSLLSRNDTANILLHNGGYDSTVKRLMQTMQDEPEVRARFGIPEDADDETTRNMIWDSINAEALDGAMASAARPDGTVDTEALFKGVNNFLAFTPQRVPLGDILSSGTFTPEQSEQLYRTYVKSTLVKNVGAIGASKYMSDEIAGIREAAKYNPEIKDGFSALAFPKIVSAVSQGEAGADMSDADRQMVRLADEWMPHEMKVQAAAQGMANMSPVEFWDKFGSSDGNKDYGGFKDAMEVAAIDRMGYDQAFRKESLDRYFAGKMSGAGLSKKGQEAMTDMILNMDPSNIFYEGMSLEDFRKRSNMLIAAKSSPDGGLLANIPEDRRQALEDAYVAQAKLVGMDLFKKNPFKAAPLLAGIYAKAKGFDGIGSAMENPVVFYGGIALLLMCAFGIGGSLFGDDDDDDGDAKSIVNELAEQRRLLADARAQELQ